MSKPIQPNQFWQSKKGQTVTQSGLTFAIVLGVILFAGAISRASTWYLDEQRANRASLDNGPLQSNYQARAGER